MTKILFVCHGNICRSPMAEFVMKDLAARAGLSEEFEIASAATSSEEVGNPVIRPPGASCRSTGFIRQERPPVSSGERTMPAMTAWWEWTGPTCAICDASAADT